MIHASSENREVASRDFLGLQLRDLPYFRALLRAVEARFYQGVTLVPPTLDLGCGDGHFASIAFDHPLEIGIDPWWKPLQEARTRTVYQGLAQSEGARLPFPDAYFGSAFSNSVLEHIPDVDCVLTETARVLKQGAVFVFCVPNHNFLPSLSIGRVLDKFGLRVLGDVYRSFFNCISRHHNCDNPEVWESRLMAAGFRLEQWWHYFSPDALQTLEWGHYFGLPAWISKLMTGRWILSPTSWNLAITRRFVQRFYDEPAEQEKGAYTFYIARRS